MSFRSRWPRQFLHVHVIQKLTALTVQAMGLLAEIDHPGVMVHLDSYHMNIEENSARKAVQVCGDKLGYVSTPA
jgi:sugar phosphate isomerase/epimerase